MDTITVNLKKEGIHVFINDYTKKFLTKSNLIIINDKLEIINQLSLLDKQCNDIIYYLPNNYYILYVGHNIINSSVIQFFNNYKINLSIYDVNYKFYILLLKKYNNIYKILGESSTNEYTEFIYNIITRKRSSTKVLSILDEFSHTCFKYECTLIPLDQYNWEKQIIEEQPDILLCESAWNSYKYGIATHDNKFTIIDKIISFCKLNSIITIFWNKEDDLHYKRFIQIAKYFDIIFTTDNRCIPDYIKDTGNENVYCLEFAAQPKIHNPLNNNRKNDVFFAGRWYVNNLDRNKDLKNLITGKIYNDQCKLNIFDREKVHNISSFPLKYKKHIKDKKEYSKLCSIMNTYKIMLNTNTIIDSETMFSRRVYEGLAAGCIVLSTQSLGIEKKFGKEVLMSTSIKDTENHVTKIIYDDEYFNKLSHESYVKVINNENYKKRFKQIIDTCGLHYNELSPTIVSLIIIIKNEDLLENIEKFIFKIKKQTYSNINITVFYNNKDILLDLQNIDIDPMIIKYVYIQSEEDLRNKITLMKDCYISLLNINDVYENNFIRDSLYSYLYVDDETDMVGKKTYLDTNNKLYNTIYEHKYVTELKKYTIIFNKNRNEIVLDHILDPNKFKSEKYLKYSVERWNYKYNNLMIEDEYNYNW
jgi:hypothetical protein